MPAKVLLATRLRPEPDPVGRAAARLARDLAAELVMVYVADELATVAEVHAATGLDSDQLRERMLGDIRAAADEYVHRNLDDAQVRTVIVEGDVVESIAAAAADEAADYLVIGTEGRTPLRELILGSTANGILRRAPCPVVVVPARTPTAAGD